MRRAVRHDAGDLSHRYILEAREEVADEFGSLVTTFRPEGAIWGAPQVVRADARLRAAQIDEIVTHRITVRFRADIRPGWRLRRGSRVFEVVTAYDPDERHAWLVLETAERL